MSEILDRVGEIMKDKLNEIDKTRLKSSPHPIRWMNAAQWARNTLVHELGYMKKESPHGIWEISKRGIDYLKSNTN